MATHYIYPLTVGNPLQTLVFNKEKFIDYINSNMRYTNIYSRVYNQNSASEYILDCIYFDCDWKVHNEEVDAFKTIVAIVDWCKQHDIMCLPRYTGNGYDILILIDPNTQYNNPKNMIRNSQLWLCNKLNIVTDPQVIGDINRIHRVTNTYNHKNQGQRYVIPLSYDELLMGHEYIRELAKKPKYAVAIIGTKFWDVSSFDTEKVTEYRNVNVSFVPKSSPEILDINDDVPDCVKQLLSNPELGWDQRRIVILYLRDNGYLISEAQKILEKYLSKHKYVHCVFEERQLIYLYENSKYVFPNLIEMQKCGFCQYKQKCNKAEKGCMLYGRK